jgi:site-specific recombinase XerD
MATSKKTSSTPLSTLVEEFLAYLSVERGSSPLTIRNYKHYLGRFVDWLESEKISLKLASITSKNIQNYRLYLSKLDDGRGGVLSQKTQGYHVIAIRSFLKWLNKQDYNVLSADKLDLPKVKDRQVSFLSGEQVDRLLSAPSMSSIVGKRDKAILEILFSTGLRVSELTKLNRDSIDFDRREFGITGKGGRARVVFLSSRAAEWISLYLAARKDHYSPLFIRHKGKIDPTTEDEKMRLTPRSVQRLVKKYAKKVKIPVDVTPHVLRHSFATDLLIAGADLRSVQEMLGHKNVATTQIYTHVTNKQLKGVHDQFHGRGK